MTRAVLLKCLGEFTEAALENLLLPVPPPRYIQCTDLPVDADDIFDDGLDRASKRLLLYAGCAVYPAPNPEESGFAGARQTGRYGDHRPDNLLRLPRGWAGGRFIAPERDGAAADCAASQARYWKAVQAEFVRRTGNAGLSGYRSAA